MCFSAIYKPILVVARWDAIPMVRRYRRKISDFQSPIIWMSKALNPAIIIITAPVIRIEWLVRYKSPQRPVAADSKTMSVIIALVTDFLNLDSNTRSSGRAPSRILLSRCLLIHMRGHVPLSFLDASMYKGGALTFWFLRTPRSNFIKLSINVTSRIFNLAISFARSKARQPRVRIAAFATNEVSLLFPCRQNLDIASNGIGSRVLRPCCAVSFSAFTCKSLSVCDFCNSGNCFKP